MTSLQRKNLISLIAAFGVYVLIIIGDLRGLFGSWGFFPYFAVFLFAARKVLRNCFLNIIRGRVFDINFLMTVAAAAAFATGNYSEAVAVMIFYELGQWFQALAVGKSRNAIADLMELCPDTVTVIKDGAEEEIFPDEAEIGNVVLVRPGERVALDGAIIDGSSSFDCSVMTGESLPVDLPVGASVRGGYLNLSSPVKIRVEKTAENSAAAKIAEAVEVAASRKSRTESAVDAFARIYTPIVALGVLIMITIVPLLVGNFRVWLLRGAACLVAACPCAFVISVPLTFFGAVGCLAKRGVLVKGCEYIEALAKARVFAFDKTGTLTEGNISVVAVHGDVGEIASSAERGSSHPIAKALCRAFGGNLAVSDTVEHPGYGLECVIDGKKVLVGSEKLLRESGIEPEPPSETGIVVCVAVDGKFAGSIVLADKVKPTSAAAVRELSRQGRTVMLTGDNPSHAAAVAREVGMDDFRAGLLPADKVAELETLGKGTVYVGDGINDAPVIARADVGIAMGGAGNDIAVEAGDMVLTREDLGVLPFALKLCRKTGEVVRQNIFLSVAVKVLCLVFSAAGITGMWFAVFSDIGVLLLTLLNTGRILYYK